MKNKLYCHECIPNDYHPLRYALGKCDKCGSYTGVCEAEYRPQVIDDLFGHLTKTKKSV